TGVTGARRTTGVTGARRTTGVTGARRTMVIQTTETTATRDHPVIRGHRTTRERRAILIREQERHGPIQ
ncbi:MAG: hypothetical protein V5A55_06935, partial [Halovenus sp.]